MILPVNPKNWPDKFRYELYERAAIREFDAGQTQARALAEAESEIREAVENQKEGSG